MSEMQRLAISAFSSPALLLQALKEVYLPETGIWLADYPLTNRQAFLDVSLAVEDERQQAAGLV